jgi:nucleoside phosphorylase
VSGPGPILVCFAVPEEARPFAPEGLRDGAVRVLVTGMGAANAKRALERELSTGTPRLVITSGFAGGLNPNLAAGTVVVAPDSDPMLFARALAAGAVAGRFHCADRVAVTVAEKTALLARTGCDAVEMESGVIRAVCGERGLAAATLRVISDAAGEDLPLDFNKLLTADLRMNYVKLAGVLVRQPGKIAELKRFQGRIRTAAERLSAVLAAVIAGD